MKDFIELIKSIVAEYPHRIAIIDDGKKISYFNFFNTVNVISNKLLSKAANPKVVVDLKQGIEAYALIVAVLNVEGIYCPLNPDAPLERKMQIINEFEPNFIVIDSEDKLSEFSSSKTILINELCQGENFSEVNINYDGEKTSYVIYTSGSTGVPKGVMIYRKALNKFLEWSIPTFNAGEKDIWGQFSTLSFDLSIVDIFTCLCSGATLLAMNDANAKKFRPSSVIEKYKITVWHSVPSAIEFMIANEKSKIYDFSSLRIMSFCGEPLLFHQVVFLFNKKKELIIFNTYGPTEGTLFCTWQELRSDNYPNFTNFTLAIGKPISGWNIYLNPTDDFSEKEIIIHGEFIGKGYLGNMTDSKFKKIEINNIIVNGFETGDLVTEKNGKLYFSRRKDRQVKIKGFRVELDEIDFRINEYLNKTSVTVIRKDSIYSFIETVEKIPEIELRTYLKQKLEPFKIPNSFFSIAQLPRNNNLKVDIDSLIKLIP